jgi:glycosyltransferase involved in cell wall biosynthesis
MRIGLVYDVIYPFAKGGAERRYYEIGRRLVRRGHEVHLYGMKSWEGPDTIENEGMLCHSLGRNIPLYHASGRRSITEAIGFGLYGLRMLRAERMDVLDCGQFPYFHLLPIRAATWLGRVPMIVSWYEVWGDHWYDYLGRPGVLGKTVERAFPWIPDHIVAVSEQTRQDLIGLGVPPERVEHVPLGIEFATFQRVAPATVSHDIVSVGRLKNHKNVHVLLEAVAHLRQRRPDVTAGIVGDGPEMSDLRARAVALGLEKSVTFYGAIENFDDVIALMKAGRVFVNCSTKEGGGSITLFEANACGLPVIAVRCPNGIDPTLIEDGHNGRFVASLSACAIATEVERILEDAELRERMRAEALRFGARHDWDEVTAQYEAIYARVARVVA